MNIKIEATVNLHTCWSKEHGTLFFCFIRHKDSMQLACGTPDFKTLPALQHYLMKTYGITNKDFINLLNEYNQRSIAA